MKYLFSIIFSLCVAMTTAQVNNALITFTNQAMLVSYADVTQEFSGGTFEYQYNQVSDLLVIKYNEIVVFRGRLANVNVTLAALAEFASGGNRGGTVATFTSPGASTSGHEISFAGNAIQVFYNPTGQYDVFSGGKCEYQYSTASDLLVVKYNEVTLYRGKLAAVTIQGGLAGLATYVQEQNRAAGISEEVDGDITNELQELYYDGIGNVGITQGNLIDMHFVRTDKVASGMPNWVLGVPAFAAPPVPGTTIEVYFETSSNSQKQFLDAGFGAFPIFYTDGIAFKDWILENMIRKDSRYLLIWGHDEAWHLVNPSVAPVFDTDAQTLSIAGQNLSISNGNTVTLPIGRDTLRTFAYNPLTGVLSAADGGITRDVTIARQLDSSTWYRTATLKPSDNISDTINHTGFVGINQPAPKYQLDVRGAMMMNDSLIYTIIVPANNVEAYNVCHYSLNTNVTGAMRINTRIPFGSNTMHDIEVEAFNYTNQGRYAGTISGYTYGGTALNTAYATGFMNRNVRSYNNAGFLSFVIGDSSSVWSYPRISVRRARVAHVGAQPDQLRAWNINFSTLGINTTNYLNLSAVYLSEYDAPRNAYSTLPNVSRTDSIQPVGGVEWLASNRTQGTALGYNGIYAVGTNPTVDLFIRPKGAGNITTQFPDGNNHSVSVYKMERETPNQNLYDPRHFFGINKERYRETTTILDTITANFSFIHNFYLGNKNGSLVEAMGIRTSRTLAANHPYLYFPNTIQRKKIALYDGNASNDYSFYGLGVSSGTLQYIAPNSARHAFHVGTSGSTDTVVAQINRTGLSVLTGADATTALDVSGGIALGNSVTITASAAYTTTTLPYIVHVKNAATNVTITIPNPTTCNRRIVVIHRDPGSTGTVTVTSTSVQNLAGVLGTSATLSALGTYGQNLQLRSDGVSWKIIN